MSAPREYSEADVLRLAEAFRKQVAADINELCAPGSVRECDRRNGDPLYHVGCDAAHDFVDANMSMEAAHVAVFGSSPFPDDEDMEMDDATLALWNDAWDIAKRHGYSDPRPITGRI